jgi:hypothetical protein
MCGSVRRIYPIKKHIIMKTMVEKMKNYCANNAAWGVVVIAFLGWGTDANSPGKPTGNESPAKEVPANKVQE